MTIYLPGDEVVVSYNETTGVETMAPAFTYGTNVADNGAPYQGAYINTDGEMIQLGGMIRNTVALAAGAILIKLNSVLAPRANEMTKIEINGSSFAAEVDVNGDVTTKVAIGINGTISLNSIRFLSKDVFVVEAGEEFPTETYVPLTQSGKAYVMPVADVVTSVAVVFPVEFNEIPVVVLTPATTQPGTQVKGVGVANVRTDGFSIYLLRDGAVNTNIQWIATTAK